MAPPKGKKVNIKNGNKKVNNNTANTAVDVANPKIIGSRKFKQNAPKKKGKNMKAKAQIKEAVRNEKKSVKKHKWSETRMVKLKKSGAQRSNKNNDDDVDIVVNSEPEAEVVKLPKQSLTSPLPSKRPDVKPKRPVKDQLAEPKESLRDRMKKRLDAARFRQINEELDSAADSNPVEAFDSNPELFQKYHEAYKGRMEHWPSNPLDIIIKWARKRLTKDKVIADFGCGEARLASSLPNKVHSFDLFALNDRVTACDMSKVPLEDDSVDAAVFCLSLMGTDVSKFIAEANRVLKKNGLLKIAEVSSRFSGNTLGAFLKRMKKFGFVAKQKGQKSHGSSESDDVFLMFEFFKIRNIKNPLGKLPSVQLSPSVYKKR